MKNKKIFYGILIVVVSIIAGISLFVYLNKSGRSQDVFLDEIILVERTGGYVNTINGKGFDSINDIAINIKAPKGYAFQTGYINEVASSDGKKLTFVIPEGLSACAYTRMKENEVCPDILLGVPRDETEVWIVNKYGESNKATFTFLLTRTIEQVKEHYEAELMRTKGVVGVGVGACDGTPCIKVYLEQEIPDSIGFIVEIDGFKVEREVTGLGL